MVKTNLIAESAAQKVADRRLDNTTGQIPSSNVYAARRCLRYAANRSCTSAEHQHFGVELIDVKRVFADEKGLKLTEDEILHSLAPSMPPQVR